MSGVASTAWLSPDDGVTASVSNATPARLMRLAEAALREAARRIPAPEPNDPESYLRDYLVTTADGLAAEAELQERP